MIKNRMKIVVKLVGLVRKTDILKAELGKKLFFDKRLSGDAAISCATCHMPEHGFSHPDALSPGYPGNEHFRNSPSLINAAHKKIWMHDGRLGTNLNDVTREMLTETYLMNMDMRIMQERLKQDPEYVRMFKEAGYGEPSNGSVRKAIPEYLKTLTSRGAPFDTGGMSDAAKAGFELFKGKAGCAACHSGAGSISGIAERAKKIGKINLPLHSIKQAVEQCFIAFAKRLQPEFCSHSLVEVSQVGRLVSGQQLFCLFSGRVATVLVDQGQHSLGQAGQIE